uniref:Translation factor GUF1 homologic n=1 Tax=Rhizophora mucronata TaxID=61149 RepID=A0A2P2MGL6_RHIMU
MQGWVTLLQSTADGLTTHYLDIKKPLQWCSVACFQLRQTSTLFLPGLFSFLFRLQRVIFCLPSSLELLVFIYLVDRFPELRDALAKLQLNDAALKFEPETSSAMGFGFRCGFLGLLHMEIVQERLEREYNLNLITTAPSVVYKVNCVNSDTVECSNPSLLPEPGQRRSIEEPFVKFKYTD